MPAVDQEISSTLPGINSDGDLSAFFFFFPPLVDAYFIAQTHAGVFGHTHSDHMESWKSSISRSEVRFSLLFETLSVARDEQRRDFKECLRCYIQRWRIKASPAAPPTGRSAVEVVLQ